jgi:hypothetical protein
MKSSGRGTSNSTAAEFTYDFKQQVSFLGPRQRIPKRGYPTAHDTKKDRGREFPNGDIPRHMIQKRSHLLMFYVVFSEKFKSF